MKKKGLALLLSTAMAVSALAGCGSSAGSSTAGSTTGSSTTESAAGTEGSATTSGKPDHIIMTYLTLGQTPTDLKLVQDAINKISVAKVNVEVELKPVAISESFTNYSTWIASGEQIDLMMLCFQDPSSYIDSGSIMALDKYLDADGQDILTLGNEFPIFDGGKRDGAIYGINTVNKCYGKNAEIMVRKDYFDELGLTLKDKYSYADLTEVFKGIKAKHPDTYPLGILGSDTTPHNSQFNRFHVIDTLGAGSDTGVLMDMKSDKIVDLFETDEYYQFLKQMKEWYDAGYVMQDAATTSATMQEATNAGTTASSLVYPNEPTVVDAYNNGFSAFGGVAPLPTTEIYMSSTGATTGTYWTIPVTSKSPEAAMKFLNLIYADKDLVRLFNSGIEGKHYVKTDVEDVIAYPEGITANTNPYLCTLGVYGDMRNTFAFTTTNSREANDALTKQGMANRSVASQLGYAYNSSKMANQIIAVDTVLKQYLPALETGSVSDLDSTYKEFISALKSAGIDDIIADNQAQLDAAKVAKK